MDEASFVFFSDFSAVVHERHAVLCYLAVFLFADSMSSCNEESIARRVGNRKLTDIGFRLICGRAWLSKRSNLFAHNSSVLMAELHARGIARNLVRGAVF